MGVDLLFWNARLHSGLLIDPSMTDTLLIHCCLSTEPNHRHTILIAVIHFYLTLIVIAFIHSYLTLTVKLAFG